MNKMSRKSWNHCHGMTLVEVVAGMALLGTLLVSIVMATSRLTAQSHLATRRVQAYQVADELLTEWWNDLENIPRNQSAMVPGYDDWRWQTVTTDADIEGTDAELVTLEIFEAGVGTVSLARVEILVSVPKNEDKKPTIGPDAN